MSTTPGIIIPFDVSAHSHLVPYLAALHASCITHDHTIATFLLPLSHEKLLAWWKERIGETNEEKRVMLLLVSDLDPNGPIRGPEIKGVVMLWMPYSETGSFRGFVENLLVHKTHRGKGGAKALMSAIEAEALNRGRTLLVGRISYIVFASISSLPYDEFEEYHWYDKIALTCLISYSTPRAAARQKQFSRHSDTLNLERFQDTA